MFHIIALGEILIDFTPRGVSENSNALFERNPGGAPCNVLATMSKFGRKTGFIGKVGADDFGYFLRDVMMQNRINIDNLYVTDKYPTTLAIVHLNEQGDRSFSFYRNNSADVMLDVDDIDATSIANSRIFHFGSLSLTDNPARDATLKALDIAKEKNVVISYDPNLRPPLWDSLDRAKEMMVHGLRYANVVKMSQEELEFITGKNELIDGCESIMKQYGTKLIFVTLGSDGAFYYHKNAYKKIDTYDVEVVDTTGAGDIFMGAALHKLLEYNLDLDSLTEQNLDEICWFANVAGALSTTKTGAIPSIPSLEEILSIYKIS